MRLDHARLHQQLLQFLMRQGPSAAAELLPVLGVSQSVFSRLMTGNDALLAIGRARSTRYAARRPIEGLEAPIPIYEIGEDGSSVRHLASLHPIHPRGFYVEPKTSGAPDGVFGDLPYFLYDLRPAGFLGRLVPRRHPELALPPDVRLWSAEQTLSWLTRYGWNLVGNLIVGEQAFRHYLEGAGHPLPDTVPVSERSSRYGQMADDVLQSGAPGSSAGGEQPKFLATRVSGDDHTPVLVKFSPPGQDATSQRFADLLVCEHVALEVLRKYDQPAARSELLQTGERTFLEVERFDRIGSSGRRGLISLFAFDAEFVGSFRGWSEASARLLALGHIEAQHHRRIRWLELFGRLIGNTDMHGGNLSFFTRNTRVVDLAPAYDMVPMYYAPQYGHLASRPLEPTMPSPPDADIWREVWPAALEFWEKAASHIEISEGFRAIAEASHRGVFDLKPAVALLPRS